MGVRTVRLDKDAEEVLEQLVKETGLSISAIFREGLLALCDRLPERPRRLPFEIYEELDLGPGGYAIAPSTETRQGVRTAIRKQAD
jgi:Ribbon-helix-helix protein, copG family